MRLHSWRNVGARRGLPRGSDIELTREAQVGITRQGDYGGEYSEHTNHLSECLELRPLL